MRTLRQKSMGCLLSGLENAHLILPLQICAGDSYGKSQFILRGRAKKVWFS